MAQRKRRRLKERPSRAYDEESLEALEKRLNAVDELKAAVHLLRRQIEAANETQRRIEPILAVVEEAKRGVQPLIEERKEEAARFAALEEFAARLRDKMPRLTQKEINDAVHQARRELYGGTGRSS